MGHGRDGSYGNSEERMSFNGLLGYVRGRAVQLDRNELHDHGRSRCKASPSPRSEKKVITNPPHVHLPLPELVRRHCHGPAHDSRRSDSRNKCDAGIVEASESARPAEERGIDRVDHRLGGDLQAAKVPAVQAPDRILAASDLVKFDVDVSVGVGI